MDSNLITRLKFLIIRDAWKKFELLDLVAKKLFLTKGIGVADDKLTSFEFALRSAGIAGTNIVLISSIFPPNARLVPRKEGLKLIKPGQILFTIYSRNWSHSSSMDKVILKMSPNYMGVKRLEICVQLLEWRSRH